MIKPSPAFALLSIALLTCACGSDFRSASVGAPDRPFAQLPGEDEPVTAPLPGTAPNGAPTASVAGATPATETAAAPNPSASASATTATETRSVSAPPSTPTPASDSASAVEAVPAPPSAPAPAPAPAPAADPTPMIHPTHFCHPDASGRFTEQLQVEVGNQNGHDFGQGGGCILRPLREVWAVSLNWPLMQWRNVDASDAHAQSAPAGVTQYYRVHYKVDTLFAHPEWWMDWFHTLKAGTAKAPEKLLINFQKTEGTSHIRYFVGTISLERVSDKVTSFTYRMDVSATRSGPEDQGQNMRDVHEKLRTGSPAWNALP